MPMHHNRKFVVVTSDGLPYKIMIQIIKNTHTCLNCYKDLNSMSDMSEHMQKTQIGRARVGKECFD